MLAFRAATKKAIKDAIKSGMPMRASTRVIETSMHGPEYHGDGRYTVVGPGPYDRKWYAQITVENDRVVKVS